MQTKHIGFFLVLKVIFERRSLTKTFLAIFAVVLSVVVGLMVSNETITKQQTIEQIDTSAVRNIAVAEINRKPESAKPVAKPVTKPLSVEQPNNDPVHFQNGYTIQLMRLALKETETVDSAIARKVPADLHKRIYFYEDDYGIYNFIVFIGNFSLLTEAKLFLEKLPASLKHHKPFILNTSSVYKKYKKSPKIIQN